MLPYLSDELLLMIADSADDESLANLLRCNHYFRGIYQPKLYRRHAKISSYKPFEHAVIYYSEEANIISVLKAYMNEEGKLRQKMKGKEGYPTALAQADDVTVLDIACVRGIEKVVEFLLEQVFLQDGDCVKPLICSLEKGQHEISKLLIEKGAGLWSDTTEPVLHVAARVGQQEIVRLLIDKKEQDPNQYYEGYTVLHKVIETAGNLQTEDFFFDVIVILLQRGAQIDTTTRTKHGGEEVRRWQDRPLTLACHFGLFKIGALLLRWGAYPCLETAIDSKAAFALLQEYYDLDSRDNDAVVDFIAELMRRTVEPNLKRPETDPGFVIDCSLERSMDHMVHAATDGDFKVTHALLRAGMEVPDSLYDAVQFRCSLAERWQVDLKVAFIWLPYLDHGYVERRINTVKNHIIWHVDRERKRLKTLFEVSNDKEVEFLDSYQPRDIPQTLQEWRNDANLFFKEGSTH